MRQSSAVIDNRTKSIELFLREFTDQNLATLQAAAEDGRLNCWDSCGCLVHYHQGNYARTLHALSPVRALAEAAENEFVNLAYFWKLPGSSEQNREARCKTMLPLIAAEWARRAPKPAVAEEALETVEA